MVVDGSETMQLTDFQRRSYTRIIEAGEAALMRNGPDAPMARVIAENVAYARRKLAEQVSA